MTLEKLAKFGGSKRGENPAPTALEGEPGSRVDRIHGNLAFEAKHITLPITCRLPSDKETAIFNKVAGRIPHKLLIFSAELITLYMKLLVFLLKLPMLFLELVDLFLKKKKTNPANHPHESGREQPLKSSDSDQRSWQDALQELLENARSSRVMPRTFGYRKTLDNWVSEDS